MTVRGSPESRASLKPREIEPLRKRKRYFLRSTSITGQGLPFARITSPKRLSWPPRLSPSSKISDPSVAKMASRSTTGTSYSPLGIGRLRSRSSWVM